MFGYVDNDGISTIPDLDVPYNVFNGIFDTIKYENTSAAHVLSNDERNLSRLDSEIMFFSGHGYKQSETDMGDGVAFHTGDGVDVRMNFSMSHTKVAMWAACYSGNNTNPQNISIAEHSVVNGGAKSAVGFTKSISFSSSKKFTNNFFEKLVTGATVAESAQYGADSLLWPWDNVKDYVVFGDENVSVLDVTTSASTFSNIRINYNILDELDDNYVRYSMCENSYRYYKKIGNYISNSFVDVVFDDFEQIIKLEDYRINDENLLILELKEKYVNSSLLQKIVYNEVEFILFSEDSRNIIYYCFDNTLVPIEITMATYKSDNNIIQIPYCVNLYNGVEIDYSSINSL